MIFVETSSMNSHENLKAFAVIYRKTPLALLVNEELELRERSWEDKSPPVSKYVLQFSCTAKKEGAACT